MAAPRRTGVIVAIALAIFVPMPHAATSDDDQDATSHDATAGQLQSEPLTAHRN